MPLNPLANGNQFSILLLFIYHYTHHVVTVQSNVHMYQLYEVLVVLPRILLGVLLGNVLKFVHFFIHAEYVNSGFCKKKVAFFSADYFDISYQKWYISQQNYAIVPPCRVGAFRDVAHWFRVLPYVENLQRVPMADIGLQKYSRADICDMFSQL